MQVSPHAQLPSHESGCVCLQKESYMQKHFVSFLLSDGLTTHKAITKNVNLVSIKDYI